MLSTDRQLHCNVCPMRICLVHWISSEFQFRTPGHSLLNYFFGNSVLEVDEMCIDHTNTAKYFQNFPVNDVPELVFWFTKVHDAIDNLSF